MKHRIFTLLVAISCAICINAQTSGNCGTTLRWTYDATTNALTITGSGAMKNYTSPSSVPWYSYCSNIQSVSLPNGLTTIGNYAFNDCSGLTSITIPNSVTSIGGGAFERCTGLTTVTIPNSVTSIGVQAFRYCTGLTSPVYNTHVFAYMPTSYSGAYTILDGIESIAYEAFRDCKGLTSVTIPNSVTSIGGYAFYGCYDLTSVTIPNSVTSIGEWAFYGCSGLTSVTIPNSVTTIGYGAFYVCIGLTSVTIGNSVTSIGGGAFEGCTGLTSVTIGNSVTSIGNNAFSNCSSLTSVIIPNSVTTIGDGAFSACTGLTSVTIGNSVTSIGQYAFSGCRGLTSVTIPNSVTYIGDNAFSNCRGLTSVTIGNSVTSIGDRAFHYCIGLTSITCEAVRPPSVSGLTFYNVNEYIPIYVPAGSVNAYYNWGGFTNIQPISAESASVTTNTTSDITENSVDISWPQVTGANQYVIEIRFNSVLVCTITFNSQGQLISIAFAAPSLLRDRENNAAQALTNGWKYKVHGLDAGKTYNYSVIAKNSGGTTIDTKTGTFKTLPLSGLEEILSAPNATDSKKILIDGQIYILRDGKAYDLTGKEL